MFCFFNFSIGQSISTKAIGSYEREDLTEEYKHHESKYQN